MGKGEEAFCVEVICVCGCEACDATSYLMEPSTSRDTDEWGKRRC